MPETIDKVVVPAVPASAAAAQAAVAVVEVDMAVAEDLVEVIFVLNPYNFFKVYLKQLRSFREIHHLDCFS